MGSYNLSFFKFCFFQTYAVIGIICFYQYIYIMSIQESLEVKGIAILMMLFLHLFNISENVDLCVNTLYFWNGKPLVLALSRITAFCVPIYIFLSGYGLGLKFLKGGDMGNVQRISKLYINYWVIFILFVGLGCIVKPEIYPKNMSTFVLNFVGYECSYNYEWWFLFPYIILVLLSKYIFTFFLNLKKKTLEWTMIGLFGMHIGGNLLGKPLSGITAEFHIVQHLLWVVSLIFMFVCGAVFAKYAIFNWAKEACNRMKNGKLILGSVLIVLLILRMMFGPSVINPLFVLPAMMIYLCFVRPAWLSGVLRYFGKQSTNMWLIHTFFAYYLFKDFVYGFKYPIVIYCVLILLSLASSYVVMWMNRPLQGLWDKYVLRVKHG